MVGSSVFAALDATASNPAAQGITSGTLKLEMTNNGVGFGSAISDMAPGDQVRRFVTLANSGTLDGADLTLQATVAVASKLTTDAVKGLHVAVDSCTVAWTPGTNVCGGSTVSVLASTAFSAVIASPATLTGFASITAGAPVYLRLTFLLPDQAETTTNGTLPLNTIQGLTANMTWTFREVQRTAVNSSA